MPIFQDAKGKNISNFQKMIDEKKNTIRKYYDEIGHLYYGQYKDVNVDVTKDINARCESISNLYIEIDDLYIKILRERGLKKCAVCGTENNPPMRSALSAVRDLMTATQCPLTLSLLRTLRQLPHARSLRSPLPLRS